MFVSCVKEGCHVFFWIPELSQRSAGGRWWTLVTTPASHFMTLSYPLFNEQTGKSALVPIVFSSPTWFLSSSSWWDIVCLIARSSLRARLLGPFRVDPRWLKEALFWHNVTQLLRLPPTHSRFWGQINCKSMSAQDYIEQVFLGNVFEQDWWIARSIDMSYNFNVLDLWESFYLLYRFWIVS